MCCLVICVVVLLGSGRVRQHKDLAPRSVLTPGVTVRSLQKRCSRDLSEASSAWGSRDPGTEAKAGSSYESWALESPF